MRVLPTATLALVLSGAICGALTGCGYRFAAGGASALPSGITEVRAPIFVNDTAEPALEVPFTEAMREQLLRSGIDTRSSAEAEVQGTVLNVWGTPTVLANPTTEFPAGRLASYRIFVSVRVRLVKHGEALAQTEMTGSEDYLPGIDVLESEANRQAALHRLARRLMHDAFDELAVDH